MPGYEAETDLCYQTQQVAVNNYLQYSSNELRDIDSLTVLFNGVGTRDEFLILLFIFFSKKLILYHFFHSIINLQHVESNISDS